MTASKNVVDLRRRGPGAPPRHIAPLRFPDKKKRTPLRARRRRTRALLTLAMLVLLAGCAWAVSYVSYLARFNVSSISIVGTQNVPPRLVQAYAETQLYNGTHPYLSPENIFLYNPGRLAREIVGYFPRIKSAQVSRASMLATAVEIMVVERQPFALWCQAPNDCYSIDDRGFVFSPLEASSRTGTTTDGGPLTGFTQAPKASSTVQYVFQGGLSSSTSPIGHTFAPSHLPGILALLQALAQAGFPPQGASVDNDQDFSIPLVNSFYIKASFGEDPDTLVKNLQLILSSDALQSKEGSIEYIDLRFGDKVYYKLKGQGEAKASQ